MASVPKWKAGDLAVVTQYRTPRLAVVQPRPQAGGALQFTYLDFAGYDMVGDVAARPLVVIDPEITADVERVRDALWRGGTVDDWQAALRNLANPTPPIEEPTGLGAVVEDADGRLWVRIEPHSPGNSIAVVAWRNRAPHAIPSEYPWPKINAVRVLSEGVPAEAKS